MDNNSLLEIKGLKTYFCTDEGNVKAVDGVDFTVPRKKTVCLVGESGCGKSVTAHSILQVVTPPGRIVAGEILFHRPVNGNTGPVETIDLAKLRPNSREIREIRGKDIALIFQEPMTSLSPVHTIGSQITEALRLHLPVSKQEAQERTVELLRRVGIPRPEEQIKAYTFQLSGGMRQRAMIAMALACNPSLLIADEPTTALDVTTQAQILDLMLELQEEYGMALLFITHDLGIVAEIADEVVVMYLGWVVERGDVDSIFHAPKHPYTRALLRSIPKLGLRVREKLNSIRGRVPPPYTRPTGCVFYPRCDDFWPNRCDRNIPPRTLVDNVEVRCLRYQSLGRSTITPMEDNNGQ